MSESDQTVIELDGRKVDLPNTEPTDTKYSSTQAKYRTTTNGSPTQLARDRISSIASTTRTRPTSQLEVKLPWYKSVTWVDIRDIIPTVLILLVGLLIMVLVIPYAFSSVIKQLQQEQELNRLKKELALNKTLAAAATALPTT